MHDFCSYKSPCRRQEHVNALHLKTVIMVSLFSATYAIVLLGLVASCIAAPGTPKFSDTVLSSHGPVFLKNGPGFSFGGDQPLAMYFKVKWHYKSINSVLARTDPRGFSFGSYVNSKGELGVIRDGTGRSYRDTKLVSNREYVIVFNYDGKDISTYIDGNFAFKLAGWKASNDVRLQFGETPNYTYASFDYLRVALWNRALRPSEITASS